MRRLQNFGKHSPCIWLALRRTEVRWRFHKILWPSQNIWTLKGDKISKSNFDFPTIFTNKQNYCAQTFITYTKYRKFNSFEILPPLMREIFFSFQLELDWNYHIGYILFEIDSEWKLFSYQFNCGWKSYHLIIYTDY